MFGATVNPYDDLVTKATDENLASEDWDVNLQICDKVTEEASAGARNAVAALVKRLAHRNPNVQVYALELANTLVQNCGKPLHEELASRTWTGALTRLVNDRATVQTVQRKALRYIKDWTKQFEESGDPNLGLMTELYDQLREKNFTFDDSEPVPDATADDETRRRAEEEELMRVIELSKQDKGRNWNAFERKDGSSSGAGSSGAAAAVQKPLPGQPQQQPSYQQPQQPQPSYQQAQPAYQQAQQSQPAPGYGVPQQTASPVPENDQPLDINTATRVRALYNFSSEDVGELNFERGDVIKVLDRGFKEWWRGAARGKIGIFPVTYVEPLPEPSPRELQEEAQEEARVFASLGLVDKLLQMLSSIDTARGDRLDDRPELEEMYQASVSLQGQINALIKKYSDQKAELEHMNANFHRAMRQYEELRSGVPQQAPQPGQQPPYAAYPQQAPAAAQDPYAQQPAAHDPYAQPQHQPTQDPYPQHQPTQDPYAQQQPPAQDPYAQPQPPAQDPYAQPQQAAYQQPPAQHQQAPAQQPAAAPYGNTWPQPQPHVAQSQATGDQPNPMYYQQGPSTTSIGSAHAVAGQRQPSGAPSFPPASPPRHPTAPGAAGVGAGQDPAADHAAAWDAYYRSQGQVPPAPQAVAGAPVTESPGVMPAGQPQGGYYQQPAFQQHQQSGVDNVAAGMGRMSVGQ